MRYLILLLLCTSACGTDPVNEIVVAEDEVPDLGITVIFNSDNDSPYTLNKDLTFNERLHKTTYLDTLKPKQDTVFFPLDEKIQLVYGKTLLKFDNQVLLVRTGDTIHINAANSKTDIYKLSRNKKEEVQWSESILLPNNALRRKMEALRSVFIAEESAGEITFLKPNTKRKDEWNTRMKAYEKVIDNYYGKLIDSLSLLEGEEFKLYRNILQRNQFMELNNLNDVVKDPGLSKRLNSSEYINLPSFNNRYLSRILTSYFHKNYASNKRILLTDVYGDGFTEYPKEMQQFFKAQAIISMIVKKYDRGTILKYVSAYKDEYGTVTPLEPLLVEIEYGAIEDPDLILLDYNGKEIKWENLRQQWEGKVIYVDFWASWCAPCLRAIPFSKELQKQLKNQQVVFVYLALNDKEEAWRNMSQKHQLEENNFLILNSRSSTFITQTNLDAIPRYMVYNKKGKLIHRNAPGPDQKEAFEILNSYIKNNY